VESYVSISSNPVSQMFSAEAWRLLESSFEKVMNEPGNVEARGSMLLGSFLAGLAIEFSMLGAAHACANPLTAHFDISHGIAVSLMLPHVIRFNSPAANTRYIQLLEIAGLVATGSGSDVLSKRIDELKTAASLPATLRDCGVHQNALPSLAKEAAEQWTGKFNPRPVTEAEFLELYENAF
jgi:alcohol dehydrogenase